MATPNTAPKTEFLSPEQFLADLESTQECFPLVGGTMATRGETLEVEIAGYHAPVIDFFDSTKLSEHFGKSIEAPKVRLPLEISADFKYGFDPGEEWFREGRGAFIHVAGRKVPVRVVRLDFVGFSASWVYCDEQETEQAAS